MRKRGVTAPFTDSRISTHGSTDDTCINDKIATFHFAKKYAFQ